MAQRIWSETVPLHQLGSPEVLDLVAAYGLDVVAAVRPWELDAVPALLDNAAAHGVRLALWPMLEDRNGRWLNVVNVLAFSDFVHALLDRVAHSTTARPHPLELALDLEPPFGLVAAATNASTAGSRWAALRAAWQGAPQSISPWPWNPPWQHAHRGFVALVEGLQARGAVVSAAVVPMVLYDPEGRAGAWQRLLGTPVDGVPFDRINVMLYTSLFEGWSYGTLQRRSALGLLADGCRRVRARYGPRASVSLGAVGPGALGNEPVFRTPHELAEEVALVRSLGIDDMALFDLGGVLRRSDPNAWLQAFTHQGPAASWPNSRRSNLIQLIGQATGRTWKARL